MFDETNGFHHIEIHTKNPENLLNLFQYIYDFELIAQRIMLNYSQWFLKSGQCQIIISSIFNSDQINETSDDDYDILTSILSKQSTRNLIINRDTVFNVALHVKSISSILDRNSDIQILVSPRQATDEYGSIEYACIKSCIGNVVHTLIDTSQYTGSSLPGFIPLLTLEQSKSHQKLINGIDHVAFAMSQNSALTTVMWYEKVFGMKRFILNQEDDPFQGFSVRVGTMGMRLFANQYWKCAETICLNERPNSNIKFVFAESLIEHKESTDQITKFISQHQNQAGIQHIGLTCMMNIKDVVQITKANGAEFLSPCENYYLKENNGRVIEEAGEILTDFAKLGILLDNENDNINDQLNKRILLQIFTKSIFNNDTFFLELIERRGATGFGAGNIRALWKSIQQKLDYQM